jgi:hypothetical protein
MKVPVAFATVIIVMLLIAVVFLLWTKMNLAMLGADRNASIKLLSKFQMRFNADAGVTPERYRIALDQFVSANPGYQGLDLYREYLARGDQRDSK